MKSSWLPPLARSSASTAAKGGDSKDCWKDADADADDALVTTCFNAEEEEEEMESHVATS